MTLQERAEQILEKHCPSMNNLYLEQRGRQFRDNLVKAMIEFKDSESKAEIDRLRETVTEYKNLLHQSDQESDGVKYFMCDWFLKILPQ